MENAKKEAIVKSLVSPEVVLAIMQPASVEEAQGALRCARAAVIRYCQDNNIEFAQFGRDGDKETASMSKDGFYDLLSICIGQGLLMSVDYWMKEVEKVKKNYDDLLHHHQQSEKVSEENARQIAALQKQISELGGGPLNYN